jgi:hypothetical protein
MRNHEQTVPRASREDVDGRHKADHDEYRFHPARVRRQAGEELSMTMSAA